ncbi:MAG: Gfo/Idh/MocA family oxidoreductase [Anaerolineaceae bacterium]|nr:Gfo/Idh/MocA family oxidoreductase [Anaerolineaceae bacterium]
MDSGKPLKIGIIGCGNIVKAGHKPALEALGDVEVVAMMDVTPARLKLGQEWFHLPDDALYTDYQSLIDRDDIDIVLVTVPQQFRKEMVTYALEKGKHILSEKPVAITPAEAAAFSALAKQNNLRFGMVHNYVYFPGYKLVKSLIEQGEIGDVRVITLNYLGVIDNPGVREYQADWRHKLEAGGGVLMDMIHAVYLAEWLAGEKAIQVNAFADAPTYGYRNPEIEDLILLQVAFPSRYALINMGWGQGVGGVDVSGTQGHLRMTNEKYQTSGFNRPAELYSVHDWVRTDHEIPNEPDYLAHLAASFTGIWRDFCDAVREGRDPVATVDDAQRALEIALAGYLSGSTGRTIALPFPTDHPVYLKGIHGIADIASWENSKTRQAGIFGLG